MNEIGKKIKELRKKKGFSQEELAESSNVNLRTIQRIENGDNEPRGKTLQLICEVLELNTEDIIDYGKQSDKNYLVFFHLSVLIGIIIPTGNIVIPFILWITKKDKIIGLKEAGVNLINFQITWTFVTAITLFLGVFFKIMHVEIVGITGNLLLTYPWLLLYIVNIILPIIFAIRISKGKTQVYYPTLIRLLE